MKQLVVIIILVFFTFSCNQNKTTNNIDYEKEKVLVENTIKNTIAWAREKDTTLLYSIIANDENYLEVHPEKTVVKGIKQFKEAERLWLDNRFKHIGFETWDMHINISQDGTVAWYYCMLNDMNDWEGQSVSWENVRWTGVLEKRNGNWRMVQMHFSNPKE